MAKRETKPEANRKNARSLTNIEEVPFRSLHQAYGEAFDRIKARREHAEDCLEGTQRMAVGEDWEEEMRDYHTERRFKREHGDFPGTGKFRPTSGTVESE